MNAPDPVQGKEGMENHVPMHPLLSWGKGLPRSMSVFCVSTQGSCEQIAYLVASHTPAVTQKATARHGKRPRQPQIKVLLKFYISGWLPLRADFQQDDKIERNSLFLPTIQTKHSQARFSVRAEHL